MPMAAETQGLTDLAIAKWMRSTQRPRDLVIISTKVSGYNERYTFASYVSKGWHDMIVLVGLKRLTPARQRESCVVACDASSSSS